MPKMNLIIHFLDVLNTTSLDFSLICPILSLPLFDMHFLEPLLSEIPISLPPSN